LILQRGFGVDHGFFEHPFQIDNFVDNCALVVGRRRRKSAA
jgi:hypothetical protein